MIILDTNIISEFMTSTPARSVHEWLNQQETTYLYISTITIAEIGYGLRVIPEGRRQYLLGERFRQFLAIAFGSRILGFDKNAAEVYGEIMAHRKELGRPMSTLDGQIAAISQSKGFALATRNTRDFDECQIELINPFQE